MIISYPLRLERKITLPSTSTICWNTTMESTPKKLIYSSSRSPTTFQVGSIQSSNSLIKFTNRLLVHVLTSMSKYFTSTRHPIQKSFRPPFTPNRVTNSYDAYSATPAKKITSAIIEVKIDKSLQFQVNL